MDAYAVLCTLAGTYLGCLLVLGVMATRIDDAHRFNKLIRETRRLRHNFATPRDARKRKEDNTPVMEV
ncbi:MAG: hypothetical protein GC172_04325 [Phycisphaera sp.]|nr:hypothetical protein [Phycisphaera sp.]